MSRTDAPGHRGGGPVSRGFLITGTLVLVLTATVLAAAILRKLSGAHGPVLPVSWCRSTTTAVLPPLSGTTWFTAWQVDWIAVAVVAGLGPVYLAGVVAVARQRARRWPVLRALSFAAGLAIVVLATCSSVAVYDMAMFSAHMLGHLLLVMVAPPLLVAGRPLTLALHATRNPWHVRLRAIGRSRALGFWFCPPVALAAYAVVIVGTHLTGLMDVIMARPWAGQLEHLAYLLVGYQFFALILGNEPLRWRLSMPARLLLLAVAMAVDTFTGVVLLQASQPIQMSGGSPTHVDPLAETHLGGAIMWVGGDGIMAVIMIAVAVSWLRLPDYRRRGTRSWVEQARRANLESHAIAIRPGSGTGAPVRDVDTDDRALAAYNTWLSQLAGDQRPPGDGQSGSSARQAAR